MKDMSTEQDINIEERIGEVMSDITFKELVEQLTGSPFEKVYKDYLLRGEYDEKGNME